MPATLFVRALFDFQSTQELALTFRAGDLIEVFSQLDSGWWFGQLGWGDPGWFPSNFVKPVTDYDLRKEILSTIGPSYTAQDLKDDPKRHSPPPSTIESQLASSMSMSAPLEVLPGPSHQQQSIEAVQESGYNAHTTIASPPRLEDLNVRLPESTAKPLPMRAQPAEPRANRRYRPLPSPNQPSLPLRPATLPQKAIEDLTSPGAPTHLFSSNGRMNTVQNETSRLFPFPETSAVTGYLAHIHEGIQKLIIECHRSTTNTHVLTHLDAHTAQVIEQVRTLLYMCGLIGEPLEKAGRDASLKSSSLIDIIVQRVKTVLTKLSLSVRAAHYFPYGTPEPSVYTRISGDATELEGAISELVMEIHRMSTKMNMPTKRPLGELDHSEGRTVFEIAHPILPSNISTRKFPLVRNTAVIFRSIRNSVDVKLRHLERMSSAQDSIAEELLFLGRETVAELSGLLAFVEAIDVSSINATPGSDRRNAPSQTSPHLARSFETSAQGIYDEGMLLLMSSAPFPDHESTSSLREKLARLVMSLQGHIRRIETSISGLVAATESRVAREIRRSYYMLPRIETKGLNHQSPGNVPSHYIPKTPLPPTPLEREFLDLSDDADRASSGKSTSKSGSSGASAPSRLTGHGPIVSRRTNLKPRTVVAIRVPSNQNLKSTQDTDSDASPAISQDILYNFDGTVRGGTLDALIGHLTHPEKRDGPFFNAFFMTFQRFTNVRDVIRLLILRFNATPPDIAQHNVADWNRSTREPMRLRVINALKSVVLHFEFSNTSDAVAFDELDAFVTEISGLHPVAKLLSEQTRSIRAGQPLVGRSRTPHIPNKPPRSVVPKGPSNKRLKLLSMDPRELARQLSLKEERLFREIETQDFLARGNEEQFEGGGVAKVIALSNSVSNWIAKSVLGKNSVPERALVLKHFILTAHQCHLINNFSMMATIVAGLTLAPIRRLRRSWDEVNKKTMVLFGDMDKLVSSSSNIVSYRQMLANITPPCLPYIGVYLTALLFINQGMKDMIGDRLINFNKYQAIANIINEIRQYQSVPYNFTPVDSIGLFLDESLESMSAPEDFWDLSVTREPREGTLDATSHVHKAASSTLDF